MKNSTLIVPRVLMDLQRFAASADASQGLLSKGTTLAYTTHGGSGTPTVIEDITTVPEIGSDPEKLTSRR